MQFQFSVTIVFAFDCLCNFSLRSRFIYFTAIYLVYDSVAHGAPWRKEAEHSFSPLIAPSTIGAISISNRQIKFKVSSPRSASDKDKRNVSKRKREKPKMRTNCMSANSARNCSDVIDRTGKAPKRKVVKMRDSGSKRLRFATHRKPRCAASSGKG